MLPSRGYVSVAMCLEGTDLWLRELCFFAAHYVGTQRLSQTSHLDLEQAEASAWQQRLVYAILAPSLRLLDVVLDMRHARMLRMRVRCRTATSEFWNSVTGRRGRSCPPRIR